VWYSGCAATVPHTDASPPPPPPPTPTPHPTAPHPPQQAKLANANPLMTLLTDAERCVALRDILASCTNVTFRIRDDDTGGSSAHRQKEPRAAAAAALRPSASAALSTDSENDSGSGSSSSDEGDEGTSADGAAFASTAISIQHRRKMRKAAAMEAKLKDKKLWRDVTVPIDPRLHPVYILGRTLKRKDLRRGLSSLASAEVLKLGTRDPATLAAGLGLGAAGGDGGEGGDADAVGEDVMMSEASSSLESASSLASSLSGGEVISGFSGGSSGSSVGVDDEEGSKLRLVLPEEWRDEITRKVFSKLDVLATRCTVLAFESGNDAAAGGGPGSESTSSSSSS